MIRIEDLRSLRPAPMAVAEALGLHASPSASGSVTFSCPLHPDRRPSASLFVARSGRLRFRCFSCGHNADVVGLFRLMMPNLPFKSVVSTLYDRLSVLPAVVHHAPTFDRDYVAEALLEVAPAADDSEVRAYLQGRGLPAVHDFAAIPSDGPIRRDVACRIRRSIGGKAWEASPTTRGDDFWNPQYPLVIAHRAPDGTVAGTTRRTLDGGITPRYLIPPGSRVAWPFGAFVLPRHRVPVIAITEGALDAVAFSVLCERRVPVLGIPGAASWRDDWAALLTCDEVHLALDRDAAGDAGVAAIMESLSRQKCRPRMRRLISRAGGDWAEELRRAAV